MAVVGICAICGDDLADDGSRTCDCAARPRALSRLERAVAEAVEVAQRDGVSLRVALRAVAVSSRRSS